jgi:hypothetical protein
MRDTAQIFSDNQPITVSTVSNYAGTGFGSAGPGVLDTGALFTSPGGSGGFGQQGVFGGSPIKFILTVSVAQVFAGPAGATLLVLVQDSADNVNWNATDLSEVNPDILTTLQFPGAILLQGVLPSMGGSTNIPLPILRQFLRISYVVTLGPFTAGNVNAGLDVM